MISIKDFLDEHHVPTRLAGEHHHATQNRVQIDCPYCSPASNHFRLGISLAGGRAACWTCGSKSIADALVRATGAPWAKVKELLAGLPAVRYGHSRPRGKLEMPYGVGPLLSEHRQYLKGRGYDPDRLADLWGVRGIGMNPDGLSWRVFIPILHQGETVSWTTRGLEGAAKRYHTAKPNQEAISHKDLLFGYDLVRHAIIICEGPMDAMAIGPGAVATFGLQFSKRQVRQMLRIPNRFVCLDNEPLAQVKARQLCRDLSIHPGVTKNLILSCKDPGACLQYKPEEIAKVRKRFLD